jgi:DNA-binding transcriptional regulator YiaG
VFVTDETIQLCELYSFLTSIVFRLATEGRKVEMYELCLSHSWKHTIINTEVRDSLVSKVAHKCKKKAANLLLQNSEQSNIVPTLKTGQTLFVPTSGDAEILTIPKIARTDMDNIAKRLQAVQPRVQGGTSGTLLTPERCKQLRTEQHLSLRKLAHKAGLNKRSGFVDLSKWENGEKELALEDLEKLASVLRV